MALVPNLMQGAVRDSVRVNRVGWRVLRDYRKQKDFKRNRSFLVEEGRNRIREVRGEDTRPSLQKINS